MRRTTMFHRGVWGYDHRSRNEKTRRTNHERKSPRPGAGGGPACAGQRGRNPSFSPTEMPYPPPEKRVSRGGADAKSKKLTSGPRQTGKIREDRTTLELTKGILVDNRAQWVGIQPSQPAERPALEERKARSSKLAEGEAAKASWFSETRKHMGPQSGKKKSTFEGIGKQALFLTINKHWVGKVDPKSTKTVCFAGVCA